MRTKESRSGAGKWARRHYRHARRGHCSKQFIATAAHAERLEVLRASWGSKPLCRMAKRFEKLHFVLVSEAAGRRRHAPIADDLTPNHVVISVAASVTSKLIESVLGKPVPVIRTMPNTPSLIKKGMTALAPGKYATEEHMAQARKIFDAIGRTIILDEKHMDAVTALSASGPAFVYIIIESFAEAGVKVGLPREAATILASQMVLGAASIVLETGEHPAKLKDLVTTPAGCTIDGILELEDGGLRTH